MFFLCRCNYFQSWKYCCLAFTSIKTRNWNAGLIKWTPCFPSEKNHHNWIFPACHLTSFILPGLTTPLQSSFSHLATGSSLKIFSKIYNNLQCNTNYSCHWRWTNTTTSYIYKQGDINLYTVNQQRESRKAILYLMVNMFVKNYRSSLLQFSFSVRSQPSSQSSNSYTCTSNFT